MVYKLVLSDVDGTLINDEFQLLPPTEKSIRDLTARGVLFTIATARSKSYTKKAISSLVDACSASAYLSGSILETSSGEVLIDDPIDSERTTYLIEQCDKTGASFCCVSKDFTVAKVNHPNFKMICRTFHGDYLEISSVDVHRIETYFMLAIGDNLEPVIDTVCQHPDIETNSSRPDASTGLKLIEIKKKGVGKGRALRAIAEYNGINLADTVAIGDSIINDCPMIETAGYGVAMKNSDEEILKKADFITEKDNNEDGVGDFLRSFFGL